MQHHDLVLVQPCAEMKKMRFCCTVRSKIPLGLVRERMEACLLGGSGVYVLGCHNNVVCLFSLVLIASPVDMPCLTR